MWEVKDDREYRWILQLGCVRWTPDRRNGVPAVCAASSALVHLCEKTRSGLAGHTGYQRDRVVTLPVLRCDPAESNNAVQL
jgi:hypothetical protein